MKPTDHSARFLIVDRWRGAGQDQVSPPLFGAPSAKEKRLMAMRLLVSLCVGLVLHSLVVSAQTTSPPPSGSETIEILGAKHPELIPDYLTWQHGFSRLAHIKSNNIRPATDALGLTPNDLALAYAESAKQEERDKACAERTRRIMEMKKGTKGADVEAALHPAVLECRQEVLDAKDHLLEALSPDGRSKLEMWMLDSRKEIRVYVRKDQLAFFRQPR